jgi:hypothetical protein
METPQTLIQPERTVRKGWAAAFERMAANGDDKLLDSESLLPTEWDEQEWSWSGLAK